MAKAKIPPLTTTTRREILDVDGTPLASFSNVERAAHGDSGDMVKEKTFISIVTVDGLVYHSGMDVKLVVCTCCRRGLKETWFQRGEAPSHGLCIQTNAVRCAQPGCGSWTCPHHARQVDGQWFCRDCAPGGLLRHVVWNMLFRRVEERK